MDILLELQKKFIKYQNCFIKDEKTRQQKRKNEIDKLIQKKINKTKWGVSYSIYDGEELLEASIKSIRSCVDYVGIVYQTTSWHGQPANKNLLLLLNDLKNQGLIDELIEFKPNLKINAGKNERTKRTLGVKHARKAKVDYLICLDTDEFFIKEAVESAKYTIINEGISHSYCPIVCYSQNCKERHVDNETFAIPFFSKINIFSKVGKNYSQAITLTDPNRTISGGLFSKHYFLCNVTMHHFNWVRNNIKKKIDSSSGKETAKAYERFINTKYKIYQDEDIFGIQDSIDKYNSKYSF